MSMRMKEFFFDKKSVKDRVSKANRKALSKAGAFIRRRARSSLRRRKKASQPGRPPSVHTSDRARTLKNILFAYEPLTESLVVGPVKLNQKTLLGPDLGDTTVPQLHEFGATVTIRKMSRGRRRKPVRVRAKYPPRPFMGPALEAEQDHIPDAWSGNVGE
ncbi:MAG: hypothetical protein D6744_15450 [Planctomycetota bacterium]|nr:MAG: hypothetical protein D6744_15450 [Planctomycetota bacterium]